MHKPHQVHHNHQLFEYVIGSDNVLIRDSNGHSNLVDKKKIKGESRPNLLKKLLRLGRRNIKITHIDVEKYIHKHY